MSRPLPPHRRAVVTGIGLHTPLGDAVDTVFDRILANETGVVATPEWASVAELRSLVSAPVPDFTGKHIPRTARRTMGRLGLLAASAAQSAVAQAGLSPEQLANGRTAVVAGSTAGSGGAMAEFYTHLARSGSMRGLRATLFFQAMSHTVPANIALLLGIQGEMLATNSACASSNQAIGVAVERIRLGKADVVLAGGAEELQISSGIIFDGLVAASRGHNDSPDLTPRPFDHHRDGIVVGEGAGVLVVEELEHARSRGARILAEVVGYGTTCDAAHMSGALPEGMVRAIEWCLADGGVDSNAVDYVNAHATGTRNGDAAEAEALHRVFGDSVPVSSSKGHLGHTLGACGAIEAAVCIEALQRGTMPGTRNLERPDVAPLQLLSEPKDRSMQFVLNTNFAFGGVNSVLLLAHPEARS